MISLLIVDDEILTREGIIDALPWGKFGIDAIMQADDGIKGIEIASNCKPDIILSDVRMPNMDGIEMSKQIRKLYRDSKIIFMSGYSDKEYLMSAIELKAIRYIEKPIKRDELEKAIEESVNACAEEERKKLAETVALRRVDVSIPYIKTELTIRMSNSNIDYNQLKDYNQLELIDVKPDAEFVTVIMKLYHDSFIEDIESSRYGNEILKGLDNLMNSYGIKGISAFKDNYHIIVHVFSGAEDTKKLKVSYLKDFFVEFCSTMGIVRYFAGIGRKVQGVSRVPESYNTAVLALQKSFFKGYGTVLYDGEEKGSPYIFNEKILSDFTAFLSEGRKHEALHVIYRLTSEIRKYENTLVNYIKDIYYRFLLEMEKHASKYSMAFFDGRMNKDYLWQGFTNLQTLDEVMKFVLKRISGYFDAIEAIKQDKSSIIKIMGYVEKHYMNENLSVKDISTCVFLSPAYMCTYFKQETGKTINQYITEYRIDKAKEFLAEKANRVSDVAGMVGYSDGNYFTKLFKKSLGMTPSEYRERLV